MLDGDDGIDIPELPSDDEVKEEEPMEEVKEEEPMEEVKTEESDDIELESLDLDVPEMEEPEEEPEKEPEDIELESLDLDVPEMEESEEEPEKEPEDIELESLDLDIPEIEEPEDIPEIEKPEEKNPLEEHLTEQLTIPDVLAEWDSKRAKTEAMLKANAEKEEARKAKAMQETAELMKLISGESAEIPEDVRKILNEIEEEKQAITPIVTEDDLPRISRKMMKLVR
ncbi:MAG: hypothetical protein V8S38_01620 [Lachnospiraceae bacterium]